MDLNKAMIIGRLTHDPEMRSTPQGTPVVSFSVATNFRWKDQSGNSQEKSEYHNIVAWRKLAEICGQYLKKGSRVYLEGKLQTRTWDDQQGNKKYRTEIIADNMIMLDSKGNDSSQFGGGQNPPAFAPSSPANGGVALPPSSPAVQPPADDEIRLEDIPF